jgi:hypothetical protein
MSPKIAEAAADTIPSENTPILVMYCFAIKSIQLILFLDVQLLYKNICIFLFIYY